MQAQEGHTNRPERAADRARSGLGSHRVVWTSFGISVAIHVVLLTLYPVYGASGPENARLPFPVLTERSAALELLRLIETAQTLDAERPEDPNEIEEIESPELVPAPLILEDEAGVELTPPPPTGAELLRPRLTDELVWRLIDQSLTDLTLQQREELAVRGRIVEWADSLAAAQAAESRLTDWTYTDSDGKRWGVADGKIYLGDVVLPGTHLFGVPVGKRDEVAQWQWQWDEIMRQTVRYDILESWRDRQEAIRDRRDRERAEALPDTTRSRR
jgi:hypothetical protein